ncbi:hypothetical protein D3OALGA1CA_1449 [Olavius algarvensis associated proteobacterium Delta 3]|nr:hypothetical protein D3OALGB2SA_897 [Olavius algarvensis associated proteobacterium Delta 3]CAB5101313.1 hypothetical protein D3OALGA1CA_1449 [Olavius algarvensis associated proteobacterium Delta 3]
MSPFFFPESISTGKYNTYLVKKLLKAGFSVYIVALHPLYPNWKSKKTNEGFDGATIYRGGGYVSYPKSMILRRLCLEIEFTIHSIKQILKNRNIEIVIIVFPPSLFFSFVHLVIPKRAKIIGIVHDLQSVMANVEKPHAKNFLAQIIFFLERQSFHVCEKLIFLSKSMAKRAKGDYELEQKEISVCYPFANIENRKITKDLINIFLPNFKHVVYSGALGEKQNPYKLLQFFKALVKKRKNMICHFFSGGPIFNKLKQIQGIDSERIFFHDLVPEKNLYELYLKSDIQVIPQKFGMSDGAIPSKLPNIISAGTPIFSISEFGSEVSNLVEESGIGFCSHSWNIEKLVKDLNTFICKIDNEPNIERKKFLKNFVEKNFNVERIITAIE